MTTPRAGAYLDLRRVTKRFRGGGAAEQTVLHDVTLSIPKGTFAALVGPSGSGKSTLLGLLGALDRPDAGSLRVGELDLATADGAALSTFRRREVGFVFQSYNLLRSLDAVENVEATLQFLALSARERRARAMECLEAVGLAEVAQKLPAELSGGQQQRVAIARAVARRPNLLLADEPTGSLDRASGERVFATLSELVRSSGVTCVLVTHDVELAARADVVLRMIDGRIAS